MADLIKIRCKILVRLFLTSLAFCAWPQAAWATHICGGRSDEYTVTEVYNEFGNVIEAWCEWSSEGGGGAAAMRFYSPEEWQAFAEHGAQVEAANAASRRLAAQRYRQLQNGLWFLPGEVPFADWSPGAAPTSNRGTSGRRSRSDCTASFWTPTGAAILSVPQGASGTAMISYMGYSIPAPSKSQTRNFSLTQSGETQTVKATISRVGLGRKRVGMVSFAVPSGSILIGAIEDVQDYSLADRGTTIFSGQWHDGHKARDALARCLATR